MVENNLQLFHHGLINKTTYTCTFVYIAGAGVSTSTVTTTVSQAVTSSTVPGVTWSSSQPPGGTSFMCSISSVTGSTLPSQISFGEETQFGFPALHTASQSAAEPHSLTNTHITSFSQALSSSPHTDNSSNLTPTNCSQGMPKQRDEVKEGSNSSSHGSNQSIENIVQQPPFVSSPSTPLLATVTTENSMPVLHVVDLPEKSANVLTTSMKTVQIFHPTEKLTDGTRREGYVETVQVLEVKKSEHPSSKGHDVEGMRSAEGQWLGNVNSERERSTEGQKSSYGSSNGIKSAEGLQVFAANSERKRSTEGQKPGDGSSNGIKSAEGQQVVAANSERKRSTEGSSDVNSERKKSTDGQKSGDWSNKGIRSAKGQRLEGVSSERKKSTEGQQSGGGSSEGLALDTSQKLATACDVMNSESTEMPNKKRESRTDRKERKQKEKSEKKVKKEREKMDRKAKKEHNKKKSKILGKIGNLWPMQAGQGFNDQDGDSEIRVQLAEDKEMIVQTNRQRHDSGRSVGSDSSKRSSQMVSLVTGAIIDVIDHDDLDVGDLGENDIPQNKQMNTEANVDVTEVVQEIEQGDITENINQNNQEMPAETEDNRIEKSESFTNGGSFDTEDRIAQSVVDIDSECHTCSDSIIETVHYNQLSETSALTGERKTLHNNGVPETSAVTGELKTLHNNGVPETSAVTGELKTVRNNGVPETSAVTGELKTVRNNGVPETSAVTGELKTVHNNGVPETSAVTGELKTVHNNGVPETSAVTGELKTVRNNGVPETSAVTGEHGINQTAQQIKSGAAANGDKLEVNSGKFSLLKMDHSYTAHKPRPISNGKPKTTGGKRMSGKTQVPTEGLRRSARLQKTHDKEQSPDKGAGEANTVNSGATLTVENVANLQHRLANSQHMSTFTNIKQVESSQQVEGESSQQVEGESSQHVEGETSQQVEGESSQHVEGESSQHVEGESSQQVEAESSQHVEGESSQQVEGQSSQLVEGQSSQQVEVVTDDALSIGSYEDGSSAMSVDSEGRRLGPSQGIKTRRYRRRVSYRRGVYKGMRCFITPFVGDWI